MNFDKYTNKKIYFLGIGGISMYALAFLLKSQGAFVYGYDRTETEITKRLSSEKVPVFYTPSPENSKDADLCVCTAAIGPENEEYANVSNNGIPIIYRGEFLGEIISFFNNSIGISGTHGKSTTSGILSEIFMADKKINPTILMGAILPSIDSAYKIGSSESLIFEACEYKDSFLSFKPRISIILNVSLDHTDYFPNLEIMKSSFVKFASETEKVIVNMDCKEALDCALKSNRNVITYSTTSEIADYYSKNVSICNGETTFDLYNKDHKLCTLKISIPGRHNLSNALAAISCAIESGISLESISKGLEAFRGIKRRFELLGKVNGAKIYDDYAHHPDEVIATLDAVGEMGCKNVICFFQPHTYTRLKDFFDDFSDIFSRKYIENNIRAKFLPTYAAREKNTLGFDTEKLAHAVNGSEFFESLEKAAEYINKNAKNDEIYILMGAGDVTNISKMLNFDI